jgi:hypothetical protein
MCPHLLNIESSTSDGTSYRCIYAQVPHSCHDSGSQAYDFMLLKLESLVTNPNLVPILVNAVGSNPVNNEVLAVISFGATSEVGFGLRKVQRHERWRHSSLEL